MESNINEGERTYSVTLFLKWDIMTVLTQQQQKHINFFNNSIETLVSN